MRRAAKVDGNHPETVHHLRAIGWGVLSLAAHGRNIPDLLCVRGPFAALVELKTGSKRLTEGQALFAAHWPGIVIKANGPLDAEIQLKAEYEFAMSRPLLRTD